MDDLSRDVVVGLFDIAIACAEIANDEPQVALDRFTEAVRTFVRPAGATDVEVAARTEALAVYATYRFTKNLGTLAAVMGVPAADLVRRTGESAVSGAMLGALDE